MQRGLAALAAAGDELPGVVRVSPADDDDRLDPVQQLFERSLMLLGRQANRVDELDLGPGLSAATAARIAATVRSVAVVWQTIPSRATDRSSLRRSDSMTSKCSQVFDDSLDLDVAPPADHQHMIALGLQ